MLAYGRGKGVWWQVVGGEQLTWSKWGMATFSCTAGCEIMWMAGSETGWQLAASFFNEWGAVGERIDDGSGKWEMTKAVGREGGKHSGERRGRQQLQED